MANLVPYKCPKQVLEIYFIWTNFHGQSKKLPNCEFYSTAVLENLGKNPRQRFSYLQVNNHSLRKME